MNQRQKIGMTVLLTASVAGSLWACSDTAPTVSPEPPAQEAPADPTPIDTTPPTAPSGLKATPSAAGVALDWADNAEGDLAGYKVSRGESASGPFTPLTPTLLTVSAYNDTSVPAGRVFYYQVVAVDKSGNASGPASVNATRPALPTTFTYAPIANQPYKVSEAQGIAVGGKLYTFGGFDLSGAKACCTPTDRAYLYDPVKNSWTPIANMPDRGATHAGMTSDGTNVFYAGGYVADANWTGQIFGTKAVWRYNVAAPGNAAANTYTRLPDLPVERAAGQLEYLDGQLHYFGGTNMARTQDVGDHYVLDLANGATSWTTAKSPLPNPRHHMGSAVLNGKIYAIGGQHGHDEKLVTQTEVDVYDPASDTWTRLHDLPSARSHTANSTFVLNGRIVTAGGETSHDVAMDDVSAYDPATNSWTELTRLPMKRVSGVAAAIGDGFVFTGGSSTNSGWRATP